uniref:Uncharacterized protein n=1 Tax=Glossina palpalis gambiensis TaxID=67801 RepID=A0A1B0B7F9_9MUSC
MPVLYICVWGRGQRIITSSCIKSSRLSTRSRSVLPLPPLSLPPAPRSLPRSLLASPRVFKTSTLALRLAAAATAAATAAAAALALPTLGDRSPLVKPNAAAAADCKLALLLAAATAAAAAAAAAAAELRSLRLLLLRIKHDFAFYLELFIEILSHRFYRKLLVAPVLCVGVLASKPDNSNSIIEIRQTYRQMNMIKSNSKYRDMSRRYVY